MDVWFWGVLGAILAVNLKRRVARNLRRIVLHHFGLVACRLHFGKTPKVFFLTTIGPSGRVRDSQDQLFLTLETPNDSK